MKYRKKPVVIEAIQMTDADYSCIQGYWLGQMIGVAAAWQRRGSGRVPSGESSCRTPVWTPAQFGCPSGCRVGNPARRADLFYGSGVAQWESQRALA